MSLEDSFMEAYQKLSPDDRDKLHQIIMKHLGEKLPIARDNTARIPTPPARIMCPNCGTFIKK
jgi:hypothetical protein